MKLKYSIILLLIFSLVSCKNDSSNQKEKTVKQKSSAKVSKENSTYWQLLRTELSLTKSELKQTKVIVSKYNKLKKDLKVKSLWSGDNNKDRRQKWTVDRKSELMKVLGKAKYKAKVKFDKKNKS